MKSQKIKKRNFSSFRLDEAYKEIGVENLVKWKPDFSPITPTNFFRESLKRLNVFDLRHTNAAKTLMINTFFIESLQPFTKLKAWRKMELEGEKVKGLTDYLLTNSYDYFDLPYFCIGVEAKKDDFEQGLAQCMVEMKACKEANLKEGKDIDIYGIVTNGTTWEFYKYANNQVYFNRAYVSDDAEDLIGMLDYVFAECEKNI